MAHPFQGLEFISPDLKWTPKLPTDYEYGRECAYRYSEALAKAIMSGEHSDIMKMNETFRASIDLATQAGNGFQDGIIGR